MKTSLALVLLLVASPLVAQERTPPLASFAAAAPYELPGSTFDAGWDVKSVLVADGQTVRIFYRIADGLMMAGLEQTGSGIVAWTRPWAFGAGVTDLNVVLNSKLNASYVSIEIFGYGRVTRKAKRMVLAWGDALAMPTETTR